MAHKDTIGSFGEKIARRFLENKGYKIICENYSFRIPRGPQIGEVDIIAEKEKIICFVEVKTLKTSRFPLSPEEKVNFPKRKRLIKTAESWLSKNKIPLDSKWQIDIIAVIIEDKKARVSHFKNAISYF